MRVSTNYSNVWRVWQFEDMSENFSGTIGNLHKQIFSRKVDLCVA
jgi:hypothetical protein